MIMVRDALEVFGFCAVADVRVDIPAVALMLPDAARHCGASAPNRAEWGSALEQYHY